MSFDFWADYEDRNYGKEPDMDAKEQLQTLVRIACLHKIQRQSAKAQEAFEKAVCFWAKSGLPGSDFEEVELEFHTCHHHFESSMKKLGVSDDSWDAIAEAGYADI